MRLTRKFRQHPDVGVKRSMISNFFCALRTAVGGLEYGKICRLNTLRNYMVGSLYFLSLSDDFIVVLVTYILLL